MAIRPNATVAVIDLAARGSKFDKLSTAEMAFRKFDGLTLLEWSIRRLNESTLLDTVVITGKPEQCELVMSGSLCGAKWLPSVMTSPLCRTQEIAERTNAQWLVFVSPTCPFTDPVLLDRLIATAWSHPESDYVGFVAPNNPKLSLAKLGLVGELCGREAVMKLSDDAKAESIKMPSSGKTTCLSKTTGAVVAEVERSVPELVRTCSRLMQMRWIPLPVALQRDELQFNLATLHDLDNARAYLEAAGDDVSWQRLASLASSGMLV